MAIENKISLALVCLLPSLALANTDSESIINEPTLPLIHTTNIHTDVIPATINYSLSVGYQSGPVCLIQPGEPALSGKINVSKNDMPWTVNGDVLFKAVKNIGGYTCAQETYMPWNASGYYIVGFLLSGDTNGYKATNPALQYVRIVSPNP